MPKGFHIELAGFLKKTALRAGCIIVCPEHEQAYGREETSFVVEKMKGDFEREMCGLSRHLMRRK